MPAPPPPGALSPLPAGRGFARRVAEGRLSSAHDTPRRHFQSEVVVGCDGGATLSDTREEELRRLEDARGIFEQALWAIDQHLQSAKSASDDEIRALLDTAEPEVGRAFTTLTS